MKKEALSVYLDPEVMAQLVDLAHRKNQPKSVIAEAAIATFLTPDDSDRREAALVRRLDLLTRQGERLERDHTIAAEAIALFIKFWLTVTPPLPESAQAAAQAKGRERFELFLETLGRRLAKGQSLLREVSIDRVNGATNESEGRSTVQLRSHEAPR
jgi:predicted transcriptional regulator